MSKKIKFIIIAILAVFVAVIILLSSKKSFNQSDLLVPARQFGIRNADDILNHVLETVRQWPKYADEGGVPEPGAELVASTHRLLL